MTGQRRYARPQMDEAAELKAWRMTFKSGFDYLKSLPKIGVPINARHQPDRELAADAWARLGQAYLAARDPEAPPGWAERELGSPVAPPATTVKGRRRR